MISLTVIIDKLFAPVLTAAKIHNASAPSVSMILMFLLKVCLVELSGLGNVS